MLFNWLGALPGAAAQGMVWGIMAIGLYVTYKILDIADLTVDGSICTGGAVCAVLVTNGVNVWLAMLVALLAQYQGFADINMGRGAIVIGLAAVIIGEAIMSKFSSNFAAKLAGVILGGVFQDPLMGTAAGMMIEENLALAMRRGKHRGLRWGITKAERAEYVKMLASLDLGLETRLTSKVGLLSGGQRQAVTLLMASLNQPKLLLLDEHTAAASAEAIAGAVLEITDRIVTENRLTTVMITHNMKDAIAHGNRLIMLHEGHVIVDVEGEEKKKLTVEDLLTLFSKASGREFVSDRAMLS